MSYWNTWLIFKNWKKTKKTNTPPLQNTPRGPRKAPWVFLGNRRSSFRPSKIQKAPLEVFGLTSRGGASLMVGPHKSVRRVASVFLESAGLKERSVLVESKSFFLKTETEKEAKQRGTKTDLPVSHVPWWRFLSLVSSTVHLLRCVTPAVHMAHGSLFSNSKMDLLLLVMTGSIGSRAVKQPPCQIIESMALKLKYCNSFIHAEEETNEKPAARAGSLPPRIGGSPVDALEDEVNSQIYVEELSEKLKTKTLDIQSPLSMSSVVDTSTTTFTPTSTSEISTASLSFEEASPSPGSLGHPELCRRPCVYFFAGPQSKVVWLGWYIEVYRTCQSQPSYTVHQETRAGLGRIVTCYDRFLSYVVANIFLLASPWGDCENGDACAYCHLEHTERIVKLDKKQRTIVRAMSRGELFALISHFCQEKAEKMEMWRETRGVLSILAEGGLTMPNLSERDGRNLGKTLARMSFSNLIALALHQLGSEDEAAKRLSEAFETRCQEDFLFVFFELTISSRDNKNCLQMNQAQNSLRGFGTWT